MLVLLVACHGPQGNDKGSDTVTTPGTPDACDGRAVGAFCDGQDAVVCDTEEDEASRESCTGATICVDGGCSPCESHALQFPYADQALVDAQGFHLDVDPGTPAADRIPYLRPVVVDADGVLRLHGPIVVFGPDGSELDDGATLRTGDTLLATATAPASGSIVLETDACDAQVPFDASLPAELVGRPLDGFPWFESPELFSFEDDVVSVLVDPTRWVERVDQPYDAYVVPWRSPEAWAADPTIGAASPVSGPVAGVVPPSIVAGAVPIWEDLVEGPSLAEPYTVVLDFGRDGRLDPGDLVDGWDEPGFYVGGDLSAPGPYTPTSVDVSYSTWHTFLAYWPQEIDALGQIPLVVISHGNGHDYTWYDYLGNHFASWGYAVVVHTNDTGDTSILPAATTTWENTEAFLTHLDEIGDGAMDGHIDAHRIAWIGHSRGGEGVVLAYQLLSNGEISPTAFTADDIVYLASIAPTVWTSPEDADPLDVPVYTQIAGSADGDVTGGVESGITEYFRLFQGSTGRETVVYVQGATHNDFNCCGFDDGSGIGPGPLIGRTAAQRIAKAYFLAQLRAVFDGEALWWEYLSRPPEHFRPPGVQSPITTLLKPAELDEHLVIDDFEVEPDPAIASTGGAVAWSAAGVAQGSLNDADADLTVSADEPFNGFTWVEDGDSRPDRGAVLEWASGTDSEMVWDLLPDAQDWTAWSAVSFRAAQRTRHPYTDALDDQLSFSVEAEDAAGGTSAIDFRVYGGINPPFKRDGSGTGIGWVDEFQTIRIPVADFAAAQASIDLTQVVKLRLRFGVDWGSDQGAIGIDDVMLVQEVQP